MCMYLIEVWDVCMGMGGWRWEIVEIEVGGGEIVYVGKICMCVVNSGVVSG